MAVLYCCVTRCEIQLDLVVHFYFVVVLLKHLNSPMFLSCLIILIPNFAIRFCAVLREMNDRGLPVSASQLMFSFLLDVCIQNSPGWFLFRSF